MGRFNGSDQCSQMKQSEPMEGLSRRISALSPQKQALLGLRLSDHAGSPGTPVLNRQDNLHTTSHRRLVAYIVPKPAQAVSPEEVHRHLRANLPPHMMPSDIIYLDELPLTPNGKLDRKALPAPQARPPEETGTLVEPQNETEKVLAQIWADVLGFDRISLHDNFFEVGGDSILSIQIIARAHQAGLRLTPNQIFDHPTVAELAASIDQERPLVGTPQAPAVGSAPLTPIQHWFFEQNLFAPHHWNQAMLLQAPNDLDLPLLRQLLQDLMQQHDALRAIYRRQPAGWQQQIVQPDMTATAESHDLTQIPGEKVDDAILEVATRLQSTFNLERGPLLRAALFTLGSAESNRLLLIAHHLIIDVLSWQILLDDLETLYRQRLRGAIPHLPAPTASWYDHTRALAEHTRSSKQLRAELPYWLTEAAGGVAAIPLDLAPDPQADGSLLRANSTRSQQAVLVALDRQRTDDLLHRVPGQYSARALELLLTALTQTLTEWTSNQSLLIGLEGHGREQIGQNVNLSRTVGWFTTFFPVTLAIDPAGTLDNNLKAIKEQVRRIPNRGIGYGLLRYLAADSAARRRLAELPQPQVLFNFLGRLHAPGDEATPFCKIEGPVGPSRHPQNRRLFLLEINAQVVAGQLQLVWAYSDKYHHASTIKHLAERYLEYLVQLIDHCLSGHASGYSPSDFPLAKLDQSLLDRILANSRERAPDFNAIEDIYPLTPMQELMLLHAVSNPHLDTLATQIRYQLEGPVDVDRLRHAWQVLVERHTALRTGFLWEEQPFAVQVVYQQAPLPYTFYDLQTLPDRERQQKLAVLRQEDRERRFDPATPPLMRVTLIQLADQHYELLWSSHHLVLDRWCIDIVMREVAAVLGTDNTGPDGEGPPAPPFRNYIAWLQEQDDADAEQFWRAQLADFSSPTQLASEQPISSNQGALPYYEQTELSIPETTFTEIRQFARQHHFTLNTLLQAAWALLLSGHSGQQEVSFGIAVSGRQPAVAGIESMMGSFVNNLPVRLRVNIADKLTWLREVQQQLNTLRRYEHTSLVQLQEWSGLPPGVPLFESLLIHQASSNAAIEWPEGVSIHAISGSVRTNYPLTLLATETGTDLTLTLVYDTRLFLPEQIRQILETLTSTLAGIVAPTPLSLPAPLTVAEMATQRYTPKERGQRATGLPQDVLEHQLVKIWEMILQRQPIGVHDNFFQLGGHSLLAIRLFAHLEETFGTRLPATILSQAATIRELANIMRQADTASLQAVITFQAGGKGRPLFYISPPGEAMLAYGYFVHHLQLDRPCYGLQPLGLNGEQGPYTRAEEMAAHFTREIRTIQPDGPYLLTGTCFGGMVAVEVARQLQAQDQQVAFLGLLDTPFPNPTTSSKITWHLQKLGALEPREKVDYVVERIKRRTARLVGRFYLRRKQAMPAALNALYAQAGVAQATNSYIPEHYAGKITLFRAEGALGDAGAESVSWGWSQVATEGVDVHLVPGGHGSMMSEPHVHVLVDKFRSALAEIEVGGA